jgi:hypothetical protein
MPGVSFLKGGRKKRPFSLLLFSLLLLACRSEVARVGDLPITEEELSRQVQVSELYFPGSGQRYVALSQLLRGYLSVEVLKSLGHPVDDAILQGEAQRIDQETQAPELLKKIKGIYQGDRKLYLQSFVRGVYAERFLYHEVFLPSREIHQASRQKAEDLLKAALRSPSSFSRIAREKGTEAVTLRISATKGISPSGREMRSKESPSEAHLEQAQPLIGYLSKLQPGQLHPEVLEWPEGYQVLRLLRQEGRDWMVQSASIPKRDYEEWFWEQAGKIPVRISDPALKEELRKEVAWAQKLHLR